LDGSKKLSLLKKCQNFQTYDLCQKFANDHFFLKFSMVEKSSKISFWARFSIFLTKFLKKIEKKWQKKVQLDHEFVDEIVTRKWHFW
jgi:hypothetical protein